jgi:hypothetical protein
MFPMKMSADFGLDDWVRNYLFDWHSVGHISVHIYVGPSLEQFVVFEQDDHLRHSSSIEQGCINQQSVR